MALITCPECNNQISDRAEKCPHCGLPSKYFYGQKTDATVTVPDSKELDYQNLGNILLSFDKDYCGFFSDSHYITHREEEYLNGMYRQYYKTLCNKMIFQYVCNNARTFRVDIDSLKSFLSKMHTAYWLLVQVQARRPLWRPKSNIWWKNRVFNQKKSL